MIGGSVAPAAPGGRLEENSGERRRQGARQHLRDDGGDELELQAVQGGLCCGRGEAMGIALRG